MGPTGRNDAGEAISTLRLVPPGDGTYEPDWSGQLTGSERFALKAVAGKSAILY